MTSTPIDSDPHGRADREASPSPISALAQTAAGVLATSAPARAALQRAARNAPPALAAGLRVVTGILRAAFGR